MVLAAQYPSLMMTIPTTCVWFSPPWHALYPFRWVSSGTVYDTSCNDHQTWKNIPSDPNGITYERDGINVCGHNTPFWCSKDAHVTITQYQDTDGTQ